MSDAQPIEQVAALDTIGGGVASEKFASELARVLANIRDPNTEAKAKRKIVLEFVFIPTEDRESVGTLVQARTVLPSTKPTADMMYLAQRDGRPVATVVRRGTDPRQGVLPLKATKGGV